MKKQESQNFFQFRKKTSNLKPQTSSNLKLAKTSNLKLKINLNFFLRFGIFLIAFCF